MASPLGAIRAGLELAELSGPLTQEQELMSESVDAALSRLRFFRWAFGKVTSDVGSPSEVRATLKTIAPNIDIHAIPDTGLTPIQLKFLSLAVGLCTDKHVRSLKITVATSHYAAELMLPRNFPKISAEDTGAFAVYLRYRLEIGDIEFATSPEGISFRVVATRL